MHKPRPTFLIACLVLALSDKINGIYLIKVESLLPSCVESLDT
jgi:hypothetical protein